MNAVKKIACSLAVLATSNTVMAEAFDIKVIGTITPSACRPYLSGGGVVDYGTISPKTLKKDAYNQLENKQLKFAITCDAPAKIALTGINGRPKTAPGILGEENEGGSAKPPEGIKTDNSEYVVGLGLAGNKKIGGYSVAVSNILVDSVAVDYIYAFNDPHATTARWFLWKTLPFYGQGKLYSTVAKKGETTPLAFTNLSGQLNIQAYINKGSELDLTKPIRLDGLTTVEMVYL